MNKKSEELSFLWERRSRMNSLSLQKKKFKGGWESVRKIRA